MVYSYQACLVPHGRWCLISGFWVLIVYPGRIQWGTPRVQWFIDWFIDCFSRLLHPPRWCFFTCVYLSPHIYSIKGPKSPLNPKCGVEKHLHLYYEWYISVCDFIRRISSLHTTHPIDARDIFYRQVFGLIPAASTSQLLDSWVRSSVPEHLATVPALDKDTESSALPPPWVPHHVTASSHKMYYNLNYRYEKVFILTSWNMIFP